MQVGRVAKYRATVVAKDGKKAKARIGGGPSRSVLSALPSNAGLDMSGLVELQFMS